MSRVINRRIIFTITFKMCGCQDYDSTLETNGSRSATNSPCMIAEYS